MFFNEHFCFWWVHVREKVHYILSYPRIINNIFIKNGTPIVSIPPEVIARRNCSDVACCWIRLKQVSIAAAPAIWIGASGCILLSEVAKRSTLLSRRKLTMKQTIPR